MIICYVYPIKKLQQKERVRFEMKVKFYWIISASFNSLPSFLDTKWKASHQNTGNATTSLSTDKHFNVLIFVQCRQHTMQLRFWFVFVLGPPSFPRMSYVRACTQLHIFLEFLLHTSSVASSYIKDQNSGRTKR